MSGSARAPTVTEYPAQPVAEGGGWGSRDQIFPDIPGEGIPQVRKGSSSPIVQLRRHGPRGFTG